MCYGWHKVYSEPYVATRRWKSSHDTGRDIKLWGWRSIGLGKLLGFTTHKTKIRSRNLNKNYWESTIWSNIKGICVWKASGTHLSEIVTFSEPVCNWNQQYWRLIKSLLHMGIRDLQFSGNERWSIFIHPTYMWSSFRFMFLNDSWYVSLI